MAGIAEQLRQAVLQAAIQGKLTEQLPEDGNAEDLFSFIKKYSGKIEESKCEIDTTAMNIVLPNNWVMVRVNELFKFVDYRGKTPHKTTQGVFLVTASNIRQGYMDYTRKEYITVSEYETRKSRGITEKGDILFTTEAPMGNAALCDLEVCSCGQRIITFKSYVEKSISPELYVLFLASHSFQKQLLDNCTGTTAKGIKAEKLKNLLLPLPPLAEQHRIVARVDELMAKIDELEKVENELNALHKAFPGDMKAALLQAAMQGKLTEQLPEDGNAEDLLKSIEAEKAKLIAEKKIKKQKALELISEEDAPLQIPSNWSWAYIGDIFSHNAGKALNAKNQVGNKHKYITTSNVYWDHFELANLKEMYYTDDEVEKYSVKKGDLLVLEGGDIGRSAIWNLDVSYCIQNHLHCLRPYLASSTNVKYYYYLMMLYKQIGAVNGKGIAIQGLSANALHSIVVPVAPLAEQQRIVEKLDKLLPLCDSLEEKI